MVEKKNKSLDVLSPAFLPAKKWVVRANKIEYVVYEDIIITGKDSEVLTDAYKKYSCIGCRMSTEPLPTVMWNYSNYESGLKVSFLVPVKKYRAFQKYCDMNKNKEKEIKKK